MSLWMNSPLWKLQLKVSELMSHLKRLLKADSAAESHGSPVPLLTPHSAVLAPWRQEGLRRGPPQPALPNELKVGDCWRGSKNQIGALKWVICFEKFHATPVWERVRSGLSAWQLRRPKMVQSHLINKEETSVSHEVWEEVLQYL